MATMTSSRDQARRVEGSASSTEPILVLKRRTIDSILISLGLVAGIVLAVAGGLLTWGSTFAADYVDDELSSQNVTFPSANALADEGRADLLEHAGEAVNTGPEAEAYASYIEGHLEGVADGATYADLGTTEREARAAVEAARSEGADEATIADLQDEADTISEQRNTLFKGETLRGLLLGAYAWSTVGRIAGIAAVTAFVAAGLMLALVALGLRHHHKVAVAGG